MNTKPHFYRKVNKMKVVFICPRCSAKLQGEDSIAGKKVRCVKCQEPIVLTLPNFPEITPTAPVVTSPPEKPEKSGLDTWSTPADSFDDFGFGYLTDSEANSTTPIKIGGNNRYSSAAPAKKAPKKRSASGGKTVSKEVAVENFLKILIPMGIAVVVMIVFRVLYFNMEPSQQRALILTGLKLFSVVCLLFSLIRFIAMAWIPGLLIGLPFFFYAAQIGNEISAFFQVVAIGLAIIRSAGDDPTSERWSSEAKWAFVMPLTFCAWLPFLVFFVAMFVIVTGLPELVFSILVWLGFAVVAYTVVRLYYYAGFIATFLGSNIGFVLMVIPFVNLIPWSIAVLTNRDDSKQWGLKTVPWWAINGTLLFFGFVAVAMVFSTTEDANEVLADVSHASFFNGIEKPRAKRLSKELQAEVTKINSAGMEKISGSFGQVRDELQRFNTVIVEADNQLRLDQQDHSFFLYIDGTPQTIDLVQLIESGLPRPWQKQLLQSADRDKNKRLDQEEYNNYRKNYTSYMMATGSKRAIDSFFTFPPYMSESVEALTKADKNKDGYIDEKEDKLADNLIGRLDSPMFQREAAEKQNMLPGMFPNPFDPPMMHPDPSLATFPPGMVPGQPVMSPQAPPQMSSSGTPRPAPLMHNDDPIVETVDNYIKTRPHYANFEKEIREGDINNDGHLSHKELFALQVLLGNLKMEQMKEEARIQMEKFKKQSEEDVEKMKSQNAEE